MANRLFGNMAGMFSGNGPGNQPVPGPNGNDPNPADPNPSDPNNPDPNAGDEDESGLGALADIFKEDEEDPADPNNPNPNPNNPANPADTPEQKLANEIQAMITGITVAEDDIPAEFNPADPKQMRDLLGKTSQKAAMVAVQAAFKPMQAAMVQMVSDMKAEIRSSLQNFGGTQQNQAVLESIVPEAANPELKGLVDMLFEKAMSKKGATAKGAATMVRNGLDAMGIKNPNANSGSDPFKGGFKQGTEALDAFAPLKPPVRQQGR